MRYLRVKIGVLQLPLFKVILSRDVKVKSLYQRDRMDLNNNKKKQILVPTRPHDAYDMNAKIIFVGDIFPQRKRIQKKLKVYRSTMYSIRKTH
jgi:hypothetical protein